MVSLFCLIFSFYRKIGPDVQCRDCRLANAPTPLAVEMLVSDAVRLVTL